MSICRIVVVVFAGFWAVAVLLLAIGTYGLFGQASDPLSGVFLIPLGLPWNRLLDALGAPGFAAGLFAPGINLALLLILCRWLRRR
jgi:hypothetical protein